MEELETEFAELRVNFRAAKARLDNDAEFSVNTRLQLDKHLWEQHGILAEYGEEGLE